MDKPSPKSAKILASNLTECIACKRKLEVGSSLCSRCGSYQVAWKNHLRYWSTTISLFVFVTTALTHVISIAPEVWRMFTWKDRVEVLDILYPGSPGFIVLSNIGDGDVIVRELHWFGTVQGMGSTQTVPINKKLSFEQKVETIKLEPDEKGSSVFVKLVVASPYAPPSACLVSAMAGVSGFNQTVPTGVQLRVWRDQRAGC